jgi:rubrerythrin
MIAVTRTSITLSWLLRVLADRQWHATFELLNRATQETKPEAAARRFLKRRGKNLDEVPVDKAVEMGIRAFVQQAMSRAFTRGLVEYRGEQGSDDREIRLTGWWCQACGTRQATEKSPDNLCDSCHDTANASNSPKWCWNCGCKQSSTRQIDGLCCTCKETLNSEIS